MLSHLPDTVLRVDSSGVVVDCHSGTDCDLCFPTGNVFPFDISDCLAHTMTRNEATTCELQTGDRWYEARIHPYDPQSVLVVLRDITGDKARHEGLEAMEKASREALEKSNQELQQFVYAASHDLREPLVKVTAFGTRLQEICQNGHPWDEKSEYLLSVILSAAGRMTSLIDDLLMYSRVGRKDEPWEAFDLHGVIKEAQDNLSEQFQATKAQITTSSLPHIFGDRTQFVLLMQNLISNSLKYRHPDRTPEITITASIDDQYLRLVVEDNGIGFEMQYQDRIFQIFERLHSRSQVAGTGIGLALCKKIVERHRGEISAVGTPDKGAVFTIRLPVEALHVS